jgi:4-hydroxy-tetrahydrodipicolinate reductase
VARGDVVVEFSSPVGAAGAAALCAERGAALVSGTTGLGAAEEDALRVAARRVAIVRAANFSLGVLALRRALASALAAVPGSWDVEIVERHHRHKQDAPSGTALQLARDAAERRGYPEGGFRNGRSGWVGPRPEQEIGIHSLRGGTWVGDHAVVLAGAGEWLELRHVAEDRGAFAHGVLAAARFVATAPPGFYTLEDVAGAAAP